MNRLSITTANLPSLYGKGAYATVSELIDKKEEDRMVKKSSIVNRKAINMKLGEWKVRLRMLE